MRHCVQKWSFFIFPSVLVAGITALSGGAPKTGTVYRNPYTEVDYQLSCGLPGDKNKCREYTSKEGCGNNLSCFPYLKYDNEYGIAVDINGGMKIVFDYCFKSTQNCVPANLGSFQTDFNIKSITISLVIILKAYERSERSHFGSREA